jgi:multidrug transporter EmrE-like cation transporter
MFRFSSEPAGLLRMIAARSIENQGALLLFALNLVFNIIGNACFKVSAATVTPRAFLAWQVAGNIAGLITVLTLTGLLRVLPLGVAFPITTGLAVIGVQIFAGAVFFGETITHTQLLGTLCIVLGIMLIGSR